MFFLRFVLLLLLVIPDTSSAQEDRSKSLARSPLIDADGFLHDIAKSHQLRRSRLVSEAEFIEMAKDPKTIVLDARSSNRFQQMHIAGAKSLPFTDFTEETLAALIPSKQTRVLIYCNNNIENEPVAFPAKMMTASLNLSTYTALYSYGYENVYELSPLIDPKNSDIVFKGRFFDDNNKRIYPVTSPSEQKGLTTWNLPNFVSSQDAISRRQLSYLHSK